MSPPKAVLFDLDGTLLDTAPDLGFALNCLLQAHQKATLPLVDIRISAGQGSKGLLKLGFGINDTHPRYTDLVNELFDYYYEHLSDTTIFFPGIEAVLQHLDETNIPWGIVTNKPARFTTKLADNLQLTQRAACIISGDTLANRKPHPEPVLHACQLLKQNPSDCIYIGDAKIDVLASKAAGTASLVALYGYIAPHDNPEAWQADGYIERPMDILRWI